MKLTDLAEETKALAQRNPKGFYTWQGVTDEMECIYSAALPLAEAVLQLTAENGLLKQRCAVRRCVACGEEFMTAVGAGILDENQRLRESVAAMTEIVSLIASFELGAGIGSPGLDYLIDMARNVLKHNTNTHTNRTIR